MTRPTLIKRIAWTAAVLALPMLAVSAYAGDRDSNRSTDHRPQQTLRHDNGHARQGHRAKKFESGHHRSDRVNHHNRGHGSRYERHDGYDYRNRHHKNRNGLSFRISFGSHNRVRVVYSSGYDRHDCDYGGYYTNRWIPAVRHTRYDSCGQAYTVIVRSGYYNRVWIPRRCSRGTHY